MKKLSLQTYSLYELRKIDFDHSLKIMNMLYDVEKDNVRLLPPLVTWLYLNDKKKLETGKSVRRILDDMYDKFPNISEENALEYLKNSNNEELNKYYKSYISENLRRDENYFKDNVRELINSFQKEKGFSNYKICKLANVDVGNYHSFIKLNKNDKISLKKLMKIIEICNELN